MRNDEEDRRSSIGCIASHIGDIDYRLLVRDAAKGSSGDG